MTKPKNRKHTDTLIRVFQKELGGPPLFGTEVGVWRGENALALVEAFPSLRMRLVDCYEALPDWDHISKDEIQAIEKEAHDRLPTSSVWHCPAKDPLDVEQRFGNRRFCFDKIRSVEGSHGWFRLQDFVFLDANHYLDHVRADLAAWWPRVRPGGIFCGHDYNGLMDQRGKWGVKKAVDEFADRKGLEVHKGRGRIWWIKKGPDE